MTMDIVFDVLSAHKHIVQKVFAHSFAVLHNAYCIKHTSVTFEH